MLNPNLNRAALSRRAVALTAVLLLALTLPIAAFRAAQSGPAALIGSVYDTSGAVLPGVELTLEDARQNATKTTTDAAGRFTFTNIAPGHYVLAASLPGFRPLKNEFDLRSARDWDRAVTLQVGELTETINVKERRVVNPGPTQPPAALNAFGWAAISACRRRKPTSIRCTPRRCARPVAKVWCRSRRSSVSMERLRRSACSARRCTRTSRLRPLTQYGSGDLLRRCSTASRWK